jgi:hypothetical protein
VGQKFGEKPRDSVIPSEERNWTDPKVETTSQEASAAGGMKRAVGEHSLYNSKSGALRLDGDHQRKWFPCVSASSAQRWRMI